MVEAAEFLEELNFDHSLILNLDGNQDCFIFFFRLMESAGVFDQDHDRLCTGEAVFGQFSLISFLFL